MSAAAYLGIGSWFAHDFMDPTWSAKDELQLTGRFLMMPTCRMENYLDGWVLR